MSSGLFRDGDLRRVMTGWIAVVVLVYLGVMAAMFLLQRSLLYYPERPMGPPAENGFPLGHEVAFPAEDGTALTGWASHSRPGFPTVVYFHGNAAHLAFRAPKFQAFAEAGFGVLAVSYRGYGNSAGTPTEAGLYSDARGAVAYARDALGLPLEQMVFYGESLGSGVAVQMASEYKAGALVLEAPYLSVAKRAQELYPFLPAYYLVRDRFDSIGKIGTVKSPVMILHGEQDEVIPVTHGRALLKAANEPKEGIFYPTVNHTSFDPKQIVADVAGFLKRRGLVRD